MEIADAIKDDAPLIADAILTALGEEIVADFAAVCGFENVRKIFTNTAARDDSQYSYLNTIKCVTREGTPVGFLIAYDGARLHELRKAFFEEFENVTGISIKEKMPDETGPYEFYLDSLAVIPEFRGKGIASSLIETIGKRAAQIGKPLGLLCDKKNLNARKLYEHLGFRKVGESYFASELMDHLQRKCK